MRASVRQSTPGGCVRGLRGVRGRALAALALLAACGAEPDGDRPPSTDPGVAARAAPAEAPADSPADASAPLVVFLGDSLSAGLHLDPELAFPSVLQRELAAAGRPFRLVNAGVSGDTTAGGLARIDWLLKQEPDVVVVELGGNDGLRGQPLESVESNLRGILERIQAAGSQALLLGMDVPTSYGAEYAQGFGAIYPRLAEALDVAHVPAFLAGVGAVPEMNLEDGLHPNAAGHERLAANMRAALADLVPRAQPAGGE